jgi:hypothetical protein
MYDHLLQYFLQYDVKAIKKISPEDSGEKYVDGLVSTGILFPYTILITNFPKLKKFLNNFINIFIVAVDKGV